MEGTSISFYLSVAFGICFFGSLAFAEEEKQLVCENAGSQCNYTTKANPTQEENVRIYQNVCPKVEKTLSVCHHIIKLCPNMTKDSPEADDALKEIDKLMGCEAGSHYCPLKVSCGEVSNCGPKYNDSERSIEQSFSTEMNKENMTLGDPHKNGSFPPICEKDHFFCWKQLKCIPKDKECSFQRVENLYRDGYNGSKCKDTTIYCPVLNMCINNTGNCHPCIDAVNLFVKTCDSGTPQSCLIKRETTLKRNQECAFNCLSKHKYCLEQSKCVPEDSDCKSPENQQGEFLIKYRHFQEFCKNVHYICPRVRMLDIEMNKECSALKGHQRIELEEVVPKQQSTLPLRLTYTAEQDLKDLLRTTEMPRCIALVGNDDNAIWWYIKGASEIRIPQTLSMEKAFVICLGIEKILLRYKPVQEWFHGAASLKFVLLDQAVEKAFVKVQGQLAWIGHLYVVINPRVPVPEIEVVHNQTEMEEDTVRCVPIQVRNTVVVKKITVSLAINIAESLLKQLGRRVITDYLYYLEELKTMTTTIAIAGTDASYTSDGSFYVSKLTESGYSAWKELPGRVNIINAYCIRSTDQLCFRPRPDFSGLIRLKFTTRVTTWRKVAVGGVYYLTKLSYTNTKPAVHHILVRNINDPPMLLRAEAFLPPMPHDFDSSRNEGFLVSALNLGNQDCDNPPVPSWEGYAREPLSIDPDGATNGIAILDCPKSSAGQFEFKVPYSSWQQCSIVKDDNSLSTVLLLSPDSRIRYVPASMARMTMVDTVKQNARIRFMAWDGSDGLPVGYHKVKVAFSQTGSFSKTEAYGMVLKRGCDGVCGSMKEVDQCGICGGRSECLPCDGVKGSNAKIDDCGDCTEGSTGKKHNYRLNCRGQCNDLYHLDDCGVCQNKERRTETKDCNGDCRGTAFLSCGQYCVGGKTGKSENYGKDACGICGGDNSSCSACVNGKCDMKIWFKSPLSITTNQEITLTFTASNVEKYNTVSCFAISDTQTSRGMKKDLGKTTLKHGQGSWFEFSKPAEFLIQGIYIFECQLDADAQIKVLNSLKVIQGSMQVASLVPNEAEYQKKAWILVKGTGFKNESNLACYINNKAVSRAFFVNSTSVYCTVNPLQSLPVIWIDVQLYQGDQDQISIAMMRGKELHIYVEKPYAVSAKFTWGFQAAQIYVSKRWVLSATPPKSPCNIFFNTSTVRMFGRGARCQFNQKYPRHIYLRFGKDSVITEESYLYFSNEFMSLDVKFLQKQNENALKSLKIEEMTVEPVARIVGPSEIAFCEIAKYDASRSNGGAGKGLSYFWSVHLLDAADSSSTASLEELMKTVQRVKGPFLKISGSDIMPDKRYVLKLCVKNVFQITACSHMQFKREDSDNLHLYLGPAKRTVSVSKANTEGRSMKLFFSNCKRSALSNNEYYYEWDIDDPMVTLYGRNSKILKIKAGSLIANKNYTLTLTVIHKKDPTIISRSQIIWFAKGKPLKAIIKGGNRVVSCHSSFQLDGSLSYDPDKSSEKERFEWDCFEEDGRPCVLQLDQDTQSAPQANKKLTFMTGTTLACNKSYTFVLQYYKGQRSSRKVVTIYVKKGSVPGVSISSLTSKDKTVVYFQCNITTNSNVGQRWTTFQRNGSVAVNFEDNEVFEQTPEERIVKKPTSLDLISKKITLAMNVAPWMYNETINIGCEISNREVKASANMTQSFHAPPIVGTFTADPLVGFSENTSFRLFAEGWESSTDSGGLSYSFGYLWPKDSTCTEHRKVKLISLEDDNLAENVMLPPGCAEKNFTLQLFAMATDDEGSSSIAYTEVQVLQSDSLPLDLEEMVDYKNLLMQQKAFDAATGHAIVALHSLEAAGHTTNKSSELRKNVKQSAAKLAASVLRQVMEATVINKALLIALSATNNTGEGNKIEPEAIEDVSKSIVQSLSLNAGNVEWEAVMRKVLTYSPKRKKRAIEMLDQEYEDIEKGWEGLSIDEAFLSMQVFENLINVTEHDDLQDRLKANYMDVVFHVSRLFCGELFVENETLVANSSLGAVTVTVNSSDVFAKLPHQLNCEKCQLKGRAEILFGEELQHLYEQWNCSKNDPPCSDVCISSTQYTHDLLSKDANNSRVTDIAAVSFFNPDTNNPLQVKYQQKLIQYKLPMYDSVLNNEELHCCMWNKGTEGWVEEPCTTSIDWQQRTVFCNCSELGQVTVFKRVDVGKVTTEPDVIVLKEEVIVAEDEITAGPVLSTAEGKASTTLFEVSTLPVTPSTTVASQTAEPLERILHVEIKLNYDYQTYVQQSKIPQLQEEVISKVSLTAKIPERHVQNVRFQQGSIIIKFDIAQRVNGAYINLTMVESLLKDAVAAKMLQFSFSGGVLAADPTFVQMHVSQTSESPTTEQPKVNIKKQDDGFSVGKIVLIFVCISVILALLCIMIRWYLALKARNSKVMPDKDWTPMDDLKKGTLVHVNAVELPEKGHQKEALAMSWASLKNPYFGVRMQLHGIDGRATPLSDPQQ